jgi:hypothetical protein
VSRLAYHGEIGFALENRDHRLAHEALVFDDGDPDDHAQSMRPGYPEMLTEVNDAAGRRLSANLDFRQSPSRLSPDHVPMVRAGLRALKVFASCR